MRFQRSIIRQDIPPHFPNRFAGGADGLIQSIGIHVGAIRRSPETNRKWRPGPSLSKVCLTQPIGVYSGVGLVVLIHLLRWKLAEEGRCTGCRRRAEP